MALDNFRKVNITLHKANQRVLETQIAKVGDANGRELVVQITNNGVIEDQTGTTLKLNWQHENGKQGSINFNVIDIKTGRFSVYYPKEMLYKGKVNASIEISSNGKITNSMNFKIIVQADVFDGEAGTVDGVFISLADVNKKLDDREAEYVELKNRQTSVETQFNSIQLDLTDKDIVSAPEIIAARNGEDTLSDRLTKDLKNTSNEVHLATFERLDNETDDNGRFNRAISSMRAGETLVAKKEDNYYYLTDTLVIEKKINIRIENEVVYGGVKDRPIFWGKNLRHNNIYIYSIHDVGLYTDYQSGYHGWQHDDYIAFKATNFVECNLEIEKIYGTSVAYEVHSLGGDGTMFSHFRIRRVFNCRIALQLHSDGAGSWINSNYFYDLSHGFSGSPYLADEQNKYTVFQKLSNENTYGGNSNMFIHFKFEMGTMVKNWTFVHFTEQKDAFFENYRYEVSIQNPTFKFAVFDLGVDKTVSSVWNGSRKNIFQPRAAEGYGHKILFENIKRVTTNLESVAYIIGTDKTIIYNVNNVQSDYRKPSISQNVIKGFHFRKANSLLYNDTSVSQYDDRDLLTENGVNISTNSRMAIYLEDLNVGDTIEVKTIGHTPGISLKAFSGDSVISGGVIGDVTVIASDVFYNESLEQFSFHALKDKMKFTISHENVDSVVLQISGMFSGIEISSTNPSNKVINTPNTDLSKSKRFYFNIKPTYGDEGYWEYGEVVYNTDKSAGKDIGWVFKGGTTWESIGVRS